jgi:hypothetical protein
MRLKPLASRVASRALRVLPGFVVLLALANAVQPVFADDEDAAAPREAARVCSNASLAGTYGFTFQGFALNPDGTHAAEFVGVGAETFDGHGAITRGRLIGTTNGQPFTPTFTGTYTINADCTGSKTITINGQPSHYALVLVAGGREIETAQTDPGTLLAFTQVRQ